MYIHLPIENYIEYPNEITHFLIVIIGEVRLTSEIVLFLFRKYVNVTIPSNDRQKIVDTS